MASALTLFLEQVIVGSVKPPSVDIGVNIEFKRRAGRRWVTLKSPG